jgi:hypothetical protein
MKDQVIFFVSAYLLFALFQTIYLFTANILAEGMAGFFGVSIITTLAYNGRTQMKDLYRAIKYRLYQLIRYFSIH